MTEQCDVFLAYHSADKDLVEKINKKLKDRNIETWIDQDRIKPGYSIQQAIEQAIPIVKTAAIILGKDGIGAWQKWEIRAFYTQFINNEKTIIPVLLPGLDEVPETLLFLRELRWINFKTIDDIDSLNLLIWGITGEKQKSSDSSFNADIFINSGVAKSNLGDKQGAINDYSQAAQIYLMQENIVEYKKTIDLIKRLKRSICLHNFLKKIKDTKWIFVSFIILLSIILYNFLISLNSPCQNTPDYISCGEKTEFPDYSESGESKNDNKKQGKLFLKNKEYEKAIDSLTKAWTEEKDPTTLIALNNTKVMYDIENKTTKLGDVFYIAISNGFTETPKEISGSILTGVAWKQKEFNDKGLFKLIVVMADDKNNKDDALKVAKELGSRKQILGVIGPYSSKATSYVISEYFKQKIVLISSTSTASLENIKKYLKINDDKLFSWFFRPVSTTRIGARMLILYLDKKNYKNLKIFFQQEDLFGVSFYNDFYDEYTKLKLEKKISQEMKIIGPDILYSKVDVKEITNEIDKLKQLDQNKHQTALVILADAYTKSKSREKKLDIFKENKGTFLIAGSNTLFDENVFDYVSKISKDKQQIEEIIVAIPWSPSKNDKEKFANFMKIKMDKLSYQLWSVKSPQPTWHMAMSYDATEMLIHSIFLQRVKGNNRPTRKDIQNELENNFSTEGLSGTITLNGSDRKNQLYSLISLKCSSISCNWQETKIPSKSPNLSTNQN